MIARGPSVLLAAGLGLSAAAGAQAPELIVLSETGPRDKRVNVVIIGDGYRSSDKALFVQHARAFAKAMVEDQPLTGYAGYFNVYAIFVASAQAGADIPTQGISRTTYFNARYDARLGRLLVIDDNKGFQVIDNLVPERDIPVAVVNSDVYGGSGGQIAVANFSAPEIVAHEVQHSFTDLGDEYEYAGVSPWETANTTKTSTRAGVRWKHWLEPATPVPTPETNAYGSVIGVFQGAAYNATGWYRPKLTCRMRENEKPFCSVCSEAILLQVYDRVSPIDSSLPATRAVTAGTGAAPALQVVPKKPSTHALRVEWLVNGQIAADVIGPVFTRALPAGRHRVTARVVDPTALVRHDPARVLQDSAAWDVTVSGVTGAGPLSSAAAAPEILAAGQGHLRVRLPQAGPWRLSAFASDGRLRWNRAGEASQAGETRIVLPAGNPPATAASASGAQGLVFFSLEQSGRRAWLRALASAPP